MLTIQNLTVSVEDKVIINDFSFTFEKGKVYALMGPNGSGKSTLVHAIMGNLVYQVKSKKFKVKSEGRYIDLQNLDTNKRAKTGIFLSFQTPLALQGIRVAQLLQLALGKSKSALELRKEIANNANELKINPDLIQRSLNEGASGGERKKLEVLQAAILDKPIQIFDEIDTGVDVDAINDIGTFLRNHKQGKTYIVITHSNKILHYLQPDQVLVMDRGKLKLVGGPSLIPKIEAEGYQNL